MLTPPVGINAIVVKQVAGEAIPLSTAFRSIRRFLAREVVVIALQIAFRRYPPRSPS